MLANHHPRKRVSKKSPRDSVTLPDSADACTRCRATVAQMESETAAVESLQVHAIRGIQELTVRLRSATQLAHRRRRFDQHGPALGTDPGWQAEPKKCLQALARGDYDWSHMAMDYRPDQLKEECKENKSYAIAHGLDG